MDRVLTQFDDVSEVATPTRGGAAWIARESGSSRTVLIKRLPDEKTKTRATQSLALTHPHIVSTRSWLRDSGGLYIVRDYVPGRNLRSVLSDLSHRAFDKLRTVLDPILDALDYAHRSGLAHGGVTPENVLVNDDGRTMLCDFATTIPEDYLEGPQARYVSRDLLSASGVAMPRADFYGLCEIYKEFLPERPRDDEAGQEARTRLLRNLTELQHTAANVEELRYKLDAVTRMADLLGFSSHGLDETETRTRVGAKLVCHLSPPAATLTPGGVATITLSVDNGGDAPLQIETVGTDVVWLNAQSRFVPCVLPPDTGRDIIFTLSGARLTPGSYTANLILRSNHGLQTLTPPTGTPWHEQIVSLPVIVKSPVAVDAARTGNAPIAERLPLEDEPPKPVVAAAPKTISDFASTPAQPGLSSNADRTYPMIACRQEPDPGLARQGQNGVLHVGVANEGVHKLRIDKISTRPSWLVYPGEWKPIWINPGATQFLGFSVISTALAPGDYVAEVTLVTSALMPGDPPMTLWREMKCEVRVRIVREPGAPIKSVNATGSGCATLVLSLTSALGAVGVLIALCLR